MHKTYICHIIIFKTLINATKSCARSSGGIFRCICTLSSPLTAYDLQILFVSHLKFTKDFCFEVWQDWLMCIWAVLSDCCLKVDKTNCVNCWTYNKQIPCLSFIIHQSLHSLWIFYAKTTVSRTLEWLYASNE